MSQSEAGFGADERLICSCGHAVSEHDAWGCLLTDTGDCACANVPSEAIAAALGNEG